MKALIIAATAAAVLTSGALLGAPAADAAPYKRFGNTHYSKVTPAERLAIVRSKRRLNAIHRRVYADGRLSIWEQMRLGTAQRRHAALVYRLRRN